MIDIVEWSPSEFPKPYLIPPIAFFVPPHNCHLLFPLLFVLLLRVVCFEVPCFHFIVVVIVVSVVFLAGRNASDRILGPPIRRSSRASEDGMGW